ncbi:MAG: gamma carbonic anhydrase family protein [Ectothiorhodospiraceae bacterium AqS1]|nr:gamma carbonic anhydrase family protein [Ectothiorhodospiraceae bacterium AqS1]
MLFSLGDRRIECRGDFYVAENATVIGSVVLGHEASVWFNGVIRGDNDRITVGEGSNIQDCAVLHADAGFPLVLGNKVSVGHHATVHGCTIEDGCLIGINAVALNGAVIGKGSLIGANALVPEGKIIPERSLVVGSPGRVLRTLSAEEVAGIERIASHYIDKSRLYRERLQVQR